MHTQFTFIYYDNNKAAEHAQIFLIYYPLHPTPQTERQTLWQKTEQKTDTY